MGHFGDRIGQGNQPGQFTWGETAQVPLDLRASETIGTVVTVRFDRVGAGAEVDRHEDVAGLVVGGSFHAYNRGASCSLGPLSSFECAARPERGMLYGRDVTDVV